jgi:hypothetical protein
MTEEQKIFCVIKGLELFNPTGDNQDFLNYLDKFTQEAKDYFIPYFQTLTLIKAHRTRSGKYKIFKHEHLKYNTKEQIYKMIEDIKNKKIRLP